MAATDTQAAAHYSSMLESRGLKPTSIGKLVFTFMPVSHWAIVLNAAKFRAHVCRSFRNTS